MREYQCQQCLKPINKADHICDKEDQIVIQECVNASRKPTPRLAVINKQLKEENERLTKQREYDQKLWTECLDINEMLREENDDLKQSKLALANNIGAVQSTLSTYIAENEKLKETVTQRELQLTDVGTFLDKFNLSNQYIAWSKDND